MRQDLERAILDDPDALDPRMVYADWLQREGIAIGEWVALQRAIEQQPQNIGLRNAALIYLQQHAASVLGPAAEVLDGMYVGWYGGFLDEIRLHGTDRMTREHDAADRLAELLSHPAARFVRTIALGTFTEEQSPGGSDEILEVLEEHAPPLLSSLVFFDAWDPAEMPRPVRASVERIIGVLRAAPRLRRLGLSRLAQPFPHHALPVGLEELVVWGSNVVHGLDAATLPNLRELSIIDPGPEEKLPRLPALERLRIIGAANRLTRKLLAARSLLPQLELLDISHGELDAVARDMLDGLACRMKMKRMATLPSGSAYHICYGDDPEGESWLLERLAEDGRHGLAVTPHAGIGLYNASCSYNDRKRYDVALVAASAAMTFPDAAIGQSGWGNLGYAHEQLRNDAEAELAAREGLVRFPRSANFYSMLLGAVRAQGRADDAVALVPDALHTLRSEIRPEEARDCLLEIILALDERGEHARAIATANRKQRVVPFHAPIHGALALAHISAGELDVAREHLALAAKQPADEYGVTFHARAALALASGDADTALATLADIKLLRYRGWSYIARDPRFAKLHDDPRFRELFSR